MHPPGVRRGRDPDPPASSPSSPRKWASADGRPREDGSPAAAARAAVGRPAGRGSRRSRPWPGHWPTKSGPPRPRTGRPRSSSNSSRPHSQGVPAPRLAPAGAKSVVHLPFCSVIVSADRLTDPSSTFWIASDVDLCRVGRLEHVLEQVLDDLVAGRADADALRRREQRTIISAPVYVLPAPGGPWMASRPWSRRARPRRQAASSRPLGQRSAARPRLDRSAAARREGGRAPRATGHRRRCRWSATQLTQRCMPGAAACPAPFRATIGPAGRGVGRGRSVSCWSSSRRAATSMSRPTIRRRACG